MFLPYLLSQKEQKVGYFKKFFSENKLHPKFPLFDTPENVVKHWVIV